jgi:hypothetical protein
MSKIEKFIQLWSNSLWVRNAPAGCPASKRGINLYKIRAPE